MNHEMQHTDSPTWCIHCGKFDIWCKPDEHCNGEEKYGKFDSRTPEVYERMFNDLFGIPESELP